MPDFNCWKRWLLIVMTVALILRVGAAAVLQFQLDKQPGRQFLIAGDATGYWTLGEQLANGKPFELYVPPRRIMRTPGFPWVLSLGMRMFGDDIIYIRLMLALVGTAACGLVFWLGKELVDPATGVIAAGVAAVSPAFVGFTPLILSETLFAATMLLSLIAVAKLLNLNPTGESAAIPMGFPGRRLGGHRHVGPPQLAARGARMRIFILGFRTAQPTRVLSSSNALPRLGGFAGPLDNSQLSPDRSYRTDHVVGRAEPLRRHEPAGHRR